MIDWKDTDTCIQEYQQRAEKISIVKSRTFPFSMSGLMEEFKAQQELNEMPNDINDILDGQGAQEDLDILEEGLEDVPRPTTDFTSWLDDNVNAHNVKNDGNKFRQLEIQPLDELMAATKTLVPEQMLVLQKVVEFAKTTVQCKNSMLSRDSPCQLGLILHGGGGVGKSQTTKVCSQWVEHILRRAGDNPDKPRILLMAPTGMAASVVDGMTICSSLDLYFGHGYKPLSDQKMALFRSQFEDLKMIIIDEMSMVSADDIFKMHHRLTDIFQNNLPFGGISTMWVGDLLQLKPVRGRFIFEEPRDPGRYLNYLNQTY